MLEVPYRRGRQEVSALQPESREEFESAIAARVGNVIVHRDQCEEWGIQVDVVDVEPDRAMDLLFGSDEEYWEAVLLTDGEGDSTAEVDSGLVEAREAVETEAGAAE